MRHFQSESIEAISEAFEGYNQTFYVHDYLGYEILSTPLSLHHEGTLTIWLRFIAFPDGKVIAFANKVFRYRVSKERLDRVNSLCSFLNSSSRLMAYHIDESGTLNMMYCFPQLAASAMGEIAPDVLLDAKKHLETEYVLLDRAIMTDEELLFIPDKESLTINKLDAFAKEKVSEDRDREDDIEEYNERRRTLLEEREQELTEAEDETHCQFCKKEIPHREYRFCPRCGNSVSDEAVQVDSFNNIGKNAEWHPGYTDEGGMTLTCSRCRHVREDMSIEDDFNYCEHCGAAMVNAELFELQRKTLSDFIDENFYDSNFFEILYDYLEQMPYSRESVDELLDAASSWDISEVYCKLFQYHEFLRPDELAKLMNKFQTTFDFDFLDEYELEAYESLALPKETEAL